MVSQESVEKQLKKIKYNIHGWGRTEAKELKNILLEGEEIYEVVNGIYEGGFAMLVATDVRMLLIDKKPLNYLTVEDLRFEMINELDYYHRLLGAHISISAGNKNLKFTSYNQPRLRKLIGHVQHCMAEDKKQESSHQVDQKQHLEQINQQLQAYLLAQHQQQEKLHDQLLKNSQGNVDPKDIPKPEPIRPSNELSDYLFAQSLLAQYKAANNGKLPSSATQLLQDPAAADTQATTSGSMAVNAATTTPKADEPAKPAAAEVAPKPATVPDTHTTTENKSNPQMSELYAEGMQEIFGKRQDSSQAGQGQQTPAEPAAAELQDNVATTFYGGLGQPPLATVHHPLEISALSIAYSKLPMALRNRRFGRPLFHSHSKQQPKMTIEPGAQA